MKTCTKCGETKPLDDFTCDKYKKDGRTSACKNCRASHVRNKRATDPVYAQRKRQTDLARYYGYELEPLPRKSVDERFDEKWVKDENGCHIWQANTDKDGYGVFKLDNNSVRAHRWNYARAYGSISDDHELHHECGVPACVNPEHLLEVTEEAHRELHRMSD